MERIYDPRTGIRVWPHHRSANGQCAATERGYFCTVKRGHDGWHAAYGMDRTRTLHIWFDDVRPGSEVAPRRKV